MQNKALSRVSVTHTEYQKNVTILQNLTLLLAQEKYISNNNLHTHKKNIYTTSRPL